MQYLFKRTVLFDQKQGWLWGDSFKLTRYGAETELPWKIPTGRPADIAASIPMSMPFLQNLQQHFFQRRTSESLHPVAKGNKCSSRQDPRNHV
ncbi:hypothetical protein VN12_03045 [Pirellula sp. SH-Sr6A]|nr:hypothetical protein VN12_03045 [Pirellula sp. SH-Sr6A]